MLKKFIYILPLLFILSLTTVAFSASENENNNTKAMNEKLYETLTFQELLDISDDGNFTKDVKEKVNYILNNAVVDNSIRPDPGKIKESKYIGKYIRMANWNIERGMQLDKIIDIFNNPEKLIEEIEKTNPKKLEKVKKEITRLRNADVLFLTEVDAGMPRTGYKRIAEELAKKINYNYAYAVEFLEVDPSHLGVEKDYKYSEESSLFPDGIEVDKGKYRGLHGSAILSKFPLKNVRVLRLPKVYDWYNGEKVRSTKMENLKRSLAIKFFKEAVIREIRYGTRMALMADIEVPGLDDPVTCIVVHLENRTPPKGRKKQAKIILNEIENLKTPVVIAGDLNTDIADASPAGTNKRMSGKFRNLMRHFEIYNIPVKFAIGPIMSAPNLFRKHTDPTVKSIPLFSSNPERGLFNLIGKFEFDDGNHFDFRGTKGKYVGRPGNLANSNQRNHKGFTPTFSFQRSLAVGTFKLDWFFVKSYLDKPHDKNGSFKFAPHYGSTLYDLNFAFDENLSDHAPVTIDLPLDEPMELTKIEKKEAKIDNRNK